MRGAINHLALTVSDLAASERAFHAPVLEWLGYEKVEDVPEGMTLWFNGPARLALNLWQATEAGTHDRRRPGLHHLAFMAPDRSEVDEFHELLRARGITVLDPPAEYPDYGPGYYATYFACPDGMKWELAHMPVIPD
jgi:catechol 2,3-dioxygenase-like lactoylglutathione lyase family enzyme